MEPRKRIRLEVDIDVDADVEVKVEPSSVSDSDYNNHDHNHNQNNSNGPSINPESREAFPVLVHDVEYDGPLEDDPLNTCVADQALNILLIAKEIFSHLSDRDLLRCSLVNSTWHRNARIALREDRKCLARICATRSFISIYGLPVCIELDRFIKEVLPNSWSLPFNGLFFRFNQASGETHLCCPNQIQIDSKDNEISHLYQDLFSSFKIKYLRLCWNEEPKFQCPIMKLIAHVINDGEKSKDLVGLAVDQMPESATSSNFCKLFGGRRNRVLWPNIRTLELGSTDWRENNISIPILEQFLKMTPKLESIKGYVSIKYLSVILQHSKSRAVEQFYFEHREGDDFEDTSNEVNKYLDFSSIFAQEHIKIPKLSIDSLAVIPRYMYATYENRAVLLRKALRIAVDILQRSRNSVKKLDIDLLDLKSIFLNTLPPILPSPMVDFRLSRLTYLTVGCPEFKDVLPAFKLISFHSFECFCPRLSTIEIRCGSEKYGWYPDIHSIMETVDLRDVNPNDCCKTVKKMKISGTFNGVDFKNVIQKFKVLFPNVKSFTAYFETGEDFEDICKTLWTSWLDLEFLRFGHCLHGYKWTGENFDHLFTGISKADCRRFFRPWKVWNEERVKKLQVAPSLLNLTKLKLLRIKLFQRDTCKTDTKWLPARNKVFLSELTGRLVFAKMPELTVQIYRSCCNLGSHKVPSVRNSCRCRLQHLKPFVQLRNEGGT